MGKPVEPVWNPQTGGGKPRGSLQSAIPGGGEGAITAPSPTSTERAFEGLLLFALFTAEPGGRGGKTAGSSASGSPGRVRPRGRFFDVVGGGEERGRPKEASQSVAPTSSSSDEWGGAVGAEAGASGEAGAGTWEERGLGVGVESERGRFSGPKGGTRVAERSGDGGAGATGAWTVPSA